MNQHDDLAGMLTRQMHARVDGMDRAPVTLDAVKGTATGIRRRRAATATVGALAVIALAVPMALAGGPLDRADRGPGPATEGPAPTPTAPGTVVLDPDAPQGDAPGVLYVNGRTLVDGGTSLEVDADYNIVVRAGEEYVAVRQGDPGNFVDVLDADGEVVETGSTSVNVAGSADGTIAAWTTPEGEVRVRHGGRTETLGSVEPGNGFSLDTAAVVGSGSCDEAEEPRGCVVYVNHADGSAPPETITSHGNGDSVADTFAAVRAVSTTGLLAGQLESGNPDPMAPACSRVVPSDGGAEGFETCELVFGWSTDAGFSPDGTMILGMASDVDGAGPRSVQLLDSSTGDPVLTIEVEGADRNRAATLVGSAWEDDEHLLVRTEMPAETGSSYDVYRVGLDGSVERVFGPSEPSGGGNQPWLFAG